MIKFKPAAVLATIAGIGLSVGLAGCHKSTTHVKWRPDGQPRHAHPYQDWWTYQFIYHDEAQVYYEPYTATYFWYSDHQWEQGKKLPPYMNVWPSESSVVKLQDQKPYIQHGTVVRWHWPHDRAWPASADSYHGTPEAIAASEQRAIDRHYGFRQSQAESQESSNSEMAGSSSSGSSQPMSRIVMPAKGTSQFPGSHD